jgi:hypothetical protein
MKGKAVSGEEAFDDTPAMREARSRADRGKAERRGLDAERREELWRKKLRSPTIGRQITLSITASPRKGRQCLTASSVGVFRLFR